MEKTEKGTEERVIVVPGEVIGEGDYLPGEGTRKQENKIIANRYGVLDKNDNLIRVIAISGAYIPRVKNTVIGQIIDVTFNGFIIDILAPNLAFLSHSELRSKRDADFFNIRDMVVAKVKSVKPKGIDLSMRDMGMKKLEGGFIMKVNPTRVPRIIGKEGSMINNIKKETNCNITVGQNGVIWIKGEEESEMIVKKVIEFIVKKPFVEGLTEIVKEKLEKREF